MNNKSVDRYVDKRKAGITLPISTKRPRWGRNWPCMCGSGKKFKHCCLDETNGLTSIDGNIKHQNTPSYI